MARKSLAELASAGIHALWQRRAFTQSALAKQIHRPTSVVNRIIHGTQPVNLRVLEAVGDLTGTNPVELLLDPSDEMKLVTPDEARLLRYFRKWPAPTRLAFLTFASFFGDDEPVTADERRAHEQIRRLADAKKRLVYAYLTFLTEGDLPPDIRKGLGLPETDEPPQPRTRARRKHAE